MNDLFQNSHLLWLVLGIALVLWTVFLWKEWCRPLKNSFFLLALISVITIISFAMLVLLPLSERTVHSNSAVLLTRGYNQNHLDSLKKSFKGILILDYQANIPIGESLDSIGNLFVLGNGVEPYDFWQFDNRSISYLGANRPVGIIDLKYDRESSLGEKLKIKGRYHSAKPAHSIVLQDGNGHGLDSVILDTTIVQSFELSTVLKATGKFVFELVEKDSHGELVLAQPLPFKVEDKGGLKVLLINGFPTFETKYLKNYLSEMGHEVVVRSQLTRGRYKFEYLNTQKIPIYRLDEKALESFDLLIIDGNSFRNLSTNSWKSIEKTIRNNGLGFFVQPELNVFQSSSENLGLQFERDGIGSVILNEFPKLKLDKFPYKFRNVHGIEEIHSSNNTKVTAYRRMVRGRVGTTVVQNTYQLQLDGKTRTYRIFWSEVIDRLSKKNELTTDWKASESFPLENQPFQFEIRTRIETPKVFSNTNSQVPLRQHSDIPLLWNGLTYPKNKGWNTLYLQDEIQEVLDFFVVDNSSWQSLRATELQKENSRYFTELSKAHDENVVKRPINPLWFFVVGVLGISFLWLHPKIFRN